MPSHAFRKRDGRLEPADDRAKETLARVKDGDYVLVEVRRLRNPKFHRLFFAMLQLIYENQSRYRSVEQMLDAIKIYVGHYRTIRWRDGKEAYAPKSIAWSKFDETSFSVFYERVVDVVVTEIIPNVKREDLARQLREITET